MSKMPLNDHRKPYSERAPIKLIEAVKAAGSARQFAKKKGLNILYVSRLLWYGEEPTDRTRIGRAARVKMFLPAKIPKPKRPPRLPKYMKPEAIPWFVAQRERVKIMSERTKNQIKYARRQIDAE